MTTRSMKSSFFSVAMPLVVGISLSAAPVQAQNLGLTVDQLIERVGAASDAAGESLSFQKLACMANPKPGDETQTIVSCTHTLGNGRLLITNAEPDGPLLDISTQPWASGRGGLGAKMMTWIAAAINGAEPADYLEAADSLANSAAATGDATATMGEVAFYLLNFDGNLIITAQAQ